MREAAAAIIDHIDKIEFERFMNWPETTIVVLEEHGRHVEAMKKYPRMINVRAD